MNNDGKVTNKDRLMWINRQKNKKGYGDVHVSTENEDIVETMDINGDGKIETWEMQGFYKTYDLNKDGNIDDYKISQATD